MLSVTLHRLTYDFFDLVTSQDLYATADGLLTHFL